MQVTDTVRAVHTTLLGRTFFFATVLSIQQSTADDDGTNGEPTITIGFLDPTQKNLLGGADWQKAYKRITTVRHVSHDEVQQCVTEYCWEAVLPGDGTGFELDSLEMDETLPPVVAKAPADTVGTIVYINHNNGLEVFHKGEGAYTTEYGGEVFLFADKFSAETFVNAKPPAPLLKSSGIDGDAGDWTKALGEGLTYPGDTPPQSTPEGLAEQNAHDRETGNVNEANLTPGEQIAEEEPPAV
jgi:hypothetical protein